MTNTEAWLLAQYGREPVSTYIACKRIKCVHHVSLQSCYRATTDMKEWGWIEPDQEVNTRNGIPTHTWRLTEKGAIAINQEIGKRFSETEQILMYLNGKEPRHDHDR